MGRMLREVMGRVALKFPQVEEAMGMAMEMAMGMAWEAMEMGKMAEDRLRWPITTLLSFLQHGTPLPQIRLRITSSRKPLVVVKPRMCRLLL
jgi:hypothetical protein